MPEGTTTGVWIPKDSDILTRYDRHWSNSSRSKRILDAMELQLAVHDALEDVGYTIQRPKDVQAFVRQAILEQARREADDTAESTE